MRQQARGRALERRDGTLCENREVLQEGVEGIGEVEARKKLDVDFGLRIVLGQPVTFHRGS